MGKRYFWLKLKDDFFRDKRIKKLRKIAGGDTYTVIYLKLMLRSLETDGIIEYEGVESSFADELALDLDEDADNVQVTLTYLIQAGLLVDIGEHQYLLPTVKENTGGESASAQRVRDFRARQKMLQCNTSETQVKQIVNGEKEIEKEKEIDIEKEKRDRVDYQQIADMYNDTCVSFPKLTTLSDARKKSIKARLRTYTVEDFRTMFIKAEASNFLKGGNARNWSATFDWMIKDSNMAKILDGNYDNKSGQNNKTNKVAQQLDESYMMMSEWAESEDD